MKTSILLGSFLAVFLFRFSASAIPQTTAFSYQGRLNTAGTPVTGNYDFQFTLYTAASGPTSVGSPQTISTVPVTNGLFSVTLDFGVGIFTGSQVWLEIGVRTNNASSFTVLPQRQPILSTPYAITAANLSGNLPATQLSGVLPSAQLSGTYSDAVSFTNIANSFSGSGSGLTNIELAGLNSHGGLSLASNTAFFGLYGTLSVGIAPVGVTAADLNFDGTNDLISADFGAGTLSVMLGHGDGTFASPSTINVGNGPDFVAVADFNGDGTNDLATANYHDDTLTILIGVGDGTFNVLGSPVPVGAEPYSLAVADVNHDGRMDIISANYLFSSSTVTVLFGQGDGTFVEAPGSPYAVGSGPTGVAAVDLDGVNGPDIVTADQFDNQVSVLLNNGDGTFATPVAIAVGQNPVWVEALDLDGDHKPDLITANSFDNTLTVLINNGSGGFTTSSTIPVGANPFYVRAADINGDLKPDLISVNSDDGTLTVLTNSGAGVFTLAQTLTIGSSPSAVTATDIDGDGRLDLISADTGDDTLTVFTNRNGAFTVFTRFAGDGSNLTSLNAGNLTGSISDLLLSSNVPLLDGDLQQFTKRNAFLDPDNGFYGTFIGTHPDSFVGDGSFLTNLDASTLFGTIDDSRLSANVPFLSGTNSFSGTNDFSGVTIAANTANQFTGAFTGNGSALTDLNGANLTTGSVTPDKLAPTYGYFYLLSPPDAAATIPAGGAVPFPNTGPVSGITRNNDTDFVLTTAGVYEITWQVSINESAQLVLTLNGTERPETVVGRANGSSQIMGNVLIETSADNAVLEVRSASGNPTALTITPLAGGTQPVTGSLVIKRIK